MMLKDRQKRDEEIAEERHRLKKELLAERERAKEDRERDAGEDGLYANIWSHS